MPAVILQECNRCTLTFRYRPTSRTAAVPQTCSECPPLVKPKANPGPGRTRGHAVYDMALEVTRYRLAFEMIEALLRTDHVAQERLSVQRALRVCGEVEAPTRRWGSAA